MEELNEPKTGQARTRSSANCLNLSNLAFKGLPTHDEDDGQVGITATLPFLEFNALPSYATLFVVVDTRSIKQAVSQAMTERGSDGLRINIGVFSVVQ